jgi:hypothetical protein
VRNLFRSGSGILCCCIALFFSAVLSSQAVAASWTPLTNLAPANGLFVMLLLTDGSVIVQADDAQSWLKLTPDSKGSYVDGAWKTLAKMRTPRLYFASQVMPNGKLWVMGGEYTGPYFDANWGPEAEIYDPVADQWSDATSYPPQPSCQLLGNLPVTSDVQLTAGSPAISGVYSTTRIQPGWLVSGAAIPRDTRVLSVSGNTVTMSMPATATGKITARFSGIAASCFGDDPSILATPSQILAGNLILPSTYLYSISGDLFSPSGPKVYDDASDEEGWAFLGDGRVLNYDLFQSVSKGKGYAETYNPSSQLWSSVSPADGTAGGTLPVLSSPSLGYELGSMLRLNDGRALVIGGNEHTAIYDPSANSWAAGPDMRASLTGPGGTISNAKFGADDAAAATLPNGHVFLTADAGPNPITSNATTSSTSPVISIAGGTAGMQPGWSVAQADGDNGTIPQNSYIYSVSADGSTITLGNYDANRNRIQINALTTQGSIALIFGGVFSSPTQLFDYDPNAGSMTPISNPSAVLAYVPAFVTRMLVLPTGQLLFNDSTNQLYAYTPDGSAPGALRPVVNRVTYANGVFTLQGKQLNGQSAGAAYGDDNQMDENYPIVRLAKPGTGDVYYCRTTNWSLAGVGTGATPETVNFTLNPQVTPGSYVLTVSAAGITSTGIAFTVTADQIGGQSSAAVQIEH